MTQINEKVELVLPKEFLAICAENFVTPELVLRGFIADLAGITNLASDPRDDDYSSNGSDERMMAEDYFNRCCYPQFGETQHLVFIEALFGKAMECLRRQLGADEPDYVKEDLAFMIDEVMEREFPGLHAYHPDVDDLVQDVAERVRATDEFKRMPEEY